MLLPPVHIYEPDGSSISLSLRNRRAKAEILWGLKFWREDLLFCPHGAQLWVGCSLYKDNGRAPLRLLQAKGDQEFHFIQHPCTSIFGFARTKNGISSFIVERETPRIHKGGSGEKIWF